MDQIQRAVFVTENTYHHEIFLDDLFCWKIQKLKEEFCGPFCGDIILFPHTQGALKHRIRDGPLGKLIDWKQNRRSICVRKKSVAVKSAKNVCRSPHQTLVWWKRMEFHQFITAVREW